MARELGGSQISALLESVPGIVNVLRSPVADALVGMIRAGAGLGEFRLDNAKELVQYAVRRGLISGAEGDRLLEEVRAVSPRKGSRRASVAKKARAKKKATPKKATPKKAAAKKKTAKKTATSKRATAAKRTKRR
jgi:hypothetical protein